MGGEKTVFDLIVDDNNEKEIAITDFGSSNLTPSTPEEEQEENQPV
jgi:hypothetical protein